MKKLMFATALGVSVVGFGTMAEPVTYNATSFEGYTADAAVVGAGGGDVGESGVNYFYYDGDADGSSVKEFGVGENLTAPVTRTAYYAANNQANQKYLELSTEGGILWRSIDQISNENGVYDLGAAVNVAANGTYLDTLVQFTPTEDGGDPTLENGVDKLAIWLNVDQATGATNLMVRAGWVDDAGVLGSTNFVLSGKAVVAGEWYRLTVKALPDILQPNEELKYPAFMIYIDSTEMSAGCSTIDSAFVTESLGELFLDGMASKVASGSVFVSLVAGDTSADTTLQGVGFKGSGALDDLVWTEEDPLAGGSSGDDAWIATVTQIFDGANLDAAEKAKITAWASGNSIVVDTTVQGQAEIAAAAYLLGLDELPDAIPELTITAIEEGETAWTLTVAASVTTSGVTTDLELPTTINGAITLTQAGTLAGLATATPTTTGFTATVDETVTVTVPKTQAAAAFMKVGVGIAPAANAQQE